MDLLNEWRNWNPDSYPYMLEADAQFLKSHQSEICFCPERNPDFYSEDKRLHLGVLPTPFMGDMLNASVYVLMLNPGLDERDYEWDEKPCYREAVLASLKQERLEGTLPFLFLDTKFARHAGYSSWNYTQRNRKPGRGLEKLIQALARKRGVSTEEARSELGKKLAVIQLVPYHSDKFSQKRWLGRLPSVRLAQKFVQEIAAKRVSAKEAIIIAARGVNQHWDKYLRDLTEEQGVIKYASYRGEPITAYLTPKSRGGCAILRHLGVNP